MKSKTNYRGFRRILEYLKSGESTITSNEKDLVFELEDIVQMDRSNTMIRNLFSNNDKFATLLYIIESDIRNADLEINNKIVNNVQKYVDRREKLIKLKEDILAFLNGQDMDYKDTKLDLIEKCLPSLNLNHYVQQTFFGKVMINSDFSLNKDIITKVYNVLEDEKLMEELVLGVEKLDEEEKYNRIIKSCSEARKYKSRVYDNKDIIIEYNNVKNRLSDLKLHLKSEANRNYDIKCQAIIREQNDLLSNRFKAYFNKKRIEELNKQQSVLIENGKKYEYNKAQYEQLEERFKYLEEELKKHGLLDFFNNTSSNISDKSIKHSLTRMIRYFHDEKAIDDYYSFVDTEYKISREKLEEVRKNNIEYLETISSKARKLLIDNGDTCRVICEFTNYSMDDFKICPAVSLFILNGLVTIEDSSYDDKDFSVEEVNSINLYYKNVIENNYQSFLSEYVDIKNKTGRNYNKKVKE